VGLNDLLRRHHRARIDSLNHEPLDTYRLRLEGMNDHTSSALQLIRGIGRTPHWIGCATPFGGNEEGLGFVVNAGKLRLG
jgi:hypothetical protein